MRARKACISSTGLFVKKRDPLLSHASLARLRKPMAVNVKEDAVINKVIRICKKLGTEFEPP